MFAKLFGSLAVASGLIAAGYVGMADPSAQQTGDHAVCCSKDCCKDCPNCDCKGDCCKDCTSGCYYPNKQ
jgi:hypothetical protein